MDAEPRRRIWRFTPPVQLASLRRRLGWLLVDQGPVGEQLETAGRGRRSGELVLLALQAS
jgi:hypothetical protein